MNSTEAYRTVTGSSPLDLDAQVNAALAEGWELYMAPYIFEQRACQAMFRFKQPQIPQIAVESNLAG